MTDILIADPHPVYCEALRSYLLGINDELLIETVSDRGGIERAIEESGPAFTVIGGDFYDPHYFENRKAMRIVVLVDDPEEVRAHQMEHADHVFLRTMPGREWSSALAYLSGGTGAHVSMVPPREDPPIHVVSLTKREKEVLSFLAQGASNKEIARALGVQEVTVKLHVRGVCRKLGAKNRTQAALRAREYGR